MVPEWNGHRRRGAGEGGFTLVELLVVMLILGLLAAIGITSYVNQRTKAQDAEAKHALRTASHAIMAFQMDNRTYNATVAALADIEPTLGRARGFVVTGTPDTYDLAVDSASGQTFTMSRQSDGTVVRGCSAPGKGACRATPIDGQLW